MTEYRHLRVLQSLLNFLAGLPNASPTPTRVQTQDGTNGSGRVNKCLRPATGIWRPGDVRINLSAGAAPAGRPTGQAAGGQPGRDDREATRGPEAGRPGRPGRGGLAAPAQAPPKDPRRPAAKMARPQSGGSAFAGSAAAFRNVM